MGARESTARGAQETQVAGPPNYYELLQVDENATADEIKKSFRKLALIHHPDKNHENVEEATQRFAEIQQAYEVLSDEQERAWYDSHRASLIPEPDAATVFDDIKRGAPAPRGRDRGLTARHLEQFMDPSVHNGFHDNEGGFFSIYQNLFKRLAYDESLWEGRSVEEYPEFGDSSWPWAPTSKQDTSRAARTFYTFWTNFVTAKDFSWFDQWELNDAPDRRVRRMMERENKKARDDARKTYNDSVRALAMFIRKRDPRYKSHLAQQSASNAAKASGRRAPQQVDKPESASSTPAGTYVEQDWQRVSRPTDYADIEWATAETGEDSEEWECVACGKTFRSEASWNSHERSKKHLLAVERLKQEMLEEDEMLGLEAEQDEEVDEAGEDSEETAEDPDHQNEPEQAPSRFTAPTTGSETPPDERTKKNHRARSPEMLSKTEKKFMARSADVSRAGTPPIESLSLDPTRDPPAVETPTGEDDEEQPSEPGQPQLSKREKRRAREAAKKAKEAESEKVTVCNACGEKFDSRTKLFSHINLTGHAQAESPKGSSSESHSKKKGKKGNR
ncbi:hypothetical protein BC629DRAFT_1590363 [Irpex lacteus]|nr:hypothetical protein BC629DRAFT_1590363 [Irpex lacteus]